MDAPDQPPSASQSVLDDGASVHSGSGSHRTGRQSVVGASSSSRTSKLRPTSGSTSKQQSMSAQQNEERRTHTPPTDMSSGKSMWRNKLLPTSEVVSEDDKSLRITGPEMPVPIEFGPPPRSVRGGSQQVLNIIYFSAHPTYLQ